MLVPLLFHSLNYIFFNLATLLFILILDHTLQLYDQLSFTPNLYL